ncbi:MAG: acetyl-CoA decarbonylase/synthase complex subunit gamma [Christensenellaceae bacterium]|nr:acetyl-CoA decarbonylase/synthase complex subunit gamma [Christensenellaceae bacterium]
MAMTGLQIQKLLPKTNCKECGSNTCLAFAMKLAAKKAELSECPYASDEAKKILGAASEPPVKVVQIGDAKIGGETCLYRHEKTFVNQPILAVNVNDTDADAEEVIGKSCDYLLERVGEQLTIGAVAVTQTEDDPAKAAALVKALSGKKMPCVIRAKDADGSKAMAAEAKCGGVLYGGNKDNAEEYSKIAADAGLVLAVKGATLDETGEITAKIKETGFNNLLIDTGAVSPAQEFQINTVLRRAAFGDFKPFGYSFIKFVDDGDVFTVTQQATAEICKYGGVIVLPKFDAAIISSMMTLRQNIYTDPQKPIQVEPGVYKIGEPDENSYVFCTTNFSLTYFLVSGEIENSGISAWLLIPECEGLSVLTAWAAGKFSGDKIASFFKEQELYTTNKNKTIIIPGYVAQISGELQEGIPEWKVMVGTQEAGDIEAFVKANLK